MSSAFSQAPPGFSQDSEKLAEVSKHLEVFRNNERSFQNKLLMAEVAFHTKSILEIICNPTGENVRQSSVGEILECLERTKSDFLLIIKERFPDLSAAYHNLVKNGNKTDDLEELKTILTSEELFQRLSTLDLWNNGGSDMFYLLTQHLIPHCVNHKILSPDFQNIPLRKLPNKRKSPNRMLNAM